MAYDTLLKVVVQINGDIMKIKKITKRQCKPTLVYDLEVPKYHNFIINKGTVVHNCRYALEKYWKRKGN